ncbi:uncharacterized protein BDW43DRAFT_129861 [Aspergillus alliaceus]|uniref:uncharacterized protein n=1 Tax=Petromyces alliaceus TaxID=209559 RepID=UPI0012A3CDD0|nr:uncharacterized protein BDW43DRAFT_129861 [Aspergillus alliaceus]KAB8231908.1 hypothetical protein BDW43DRAFT_129861 [Aspergillus alliaceus]
MHPGRGLPLTEGYMILPYDQFSTTLHYPNLSTDEDPGGKQTIYRPVNYCWKTSTGSCPPRQINVVRQRSTVYGAWDRSDR